MPTGSLTIATRKSRLALWQAEHVASKLRAAFPNLSVRLVGVQTTGDRIQDSPLAKIGGKGLFVKELEQRLLAGDADIAVHSMKDVPVTLPEELVIAAILEREDARDALLATTALTLASLPLRSRVGTSSLRRQSQLRAVRPDLDLQALRGNVDTRLGKLENGHFDAIVLAAAGVKRLGLDSRVVERFEPDVMLPAIGQGAIGIECRRNDQRTQDLLAALNHPDTAVRLKAERALNEKLQGGCQIPIAGHASLLAEDRLRLDGLVCNLEGTEVVRGTITGPRDSAESIGFQLAEDLLSRGAAQILETVLSHVDQA